MFERRHEKLLPRRKFLRRLVEFALISVVLIIISLLIGMVGYYSFEGLSWVDAFLNSAMLIGGMGQINFLQTNAGKIFAGIYAMYCGLVLLIAVGIFAAQSCIGFCITFTWKAREKINNRTRNCVVSVTEPMKIDLHQ